MNITASIDLAGIWDFSLSGPENNAFDGSVRLPGSIQEQGFGNAVDLETPWTGQIIDRAWFTEEKYAPYRKPGNIKVPFWLQPERHYTGPAWFRREVLLPEDWKGRRIELRLERPHIRTTVWWDGREIGSQDTLAVPHVYDLGIGSASGPHTLIIRVDNRLHVDVGINSHSVSDHTQGNWNGIIGRMELVATSPVWIDEVQLYPDIRSRAVRAAVRIGNSTGQPGEGVLWSDGTKTRVEWTDQGGTVEVSVSLPQDAGLWDEFSPVLHRLHFHLSGGSADHGREIRFGLRELAAKGTQFTLNGRKIFLRGTLECCVFPRTGYPPTDETAWKRILNTIRDYGFNHVRFHSWCPPEAAFAVADELGLYLQIECSSWAHVRTTLGSGEPVDDWLYREARAIIRTHGNHPSFLFMAYGNEPGGDGHKAYLEEWVRHWKKEEPRRLHTSGAGWPGQEPNDYDNLPQPRVQQWGQGLESRINRLPPSTIADYQDHVLSIPRPLVSHEIGQWCVYPDFTEIPKYTGLLKAKNFEIFQSTLEANHLGDLSGDFLRASGRLQILCYREDIESALRTKGFGGFQVLQANDFPGQGTALVGWLNPFWESKGYTSAAEFRRFNNSTVLLARLPKRTYTDKERFSAELEIAHFGPSPFGSARLAWELLDEAGETRHSGEFPAQPIPVGNGLKLGRVEFGLEGLSVPGKYRLKAALAGSTVENDWEIWIYPAESPDAEPADVLVLRDWNDVAKHAREGKRIVFTPRPEQICSDVALGFSSIFWNTSWTLGQAPHTLGIFCDPAHPALAVFPTEFHSNWQWWELIHGSAALSMDPLPPSLRPLVYVIDDWFTNRRLGLLFEAKFQGASLLVSGVNLEGPLADRPALRQFRRSLLDYAAGGRFRPSAEVDAGSLSKLVKKA